MQSDRVCSTTDDNEAAFSGQHSDNWARTREVLDTVRMRFAGTSGQQRSEVVVTRARDLKDAIMSCTIGNGVFAMDVPNLTIVRSEGPSEAMPVLCERAVSFVDQVKPGRPRRASGWPPYPST